MVIPDVFDLAVVVVEVILAGTGRSAAAELEKEAVGYFGGDDDDDGDEGNKSDGDGRLLLLELPAARHMLLPPALALNSSLHIPAHLPLRIHHMEEEIWDQGRLRNWRSLETNSC